MFGPIAQRFCGLRVDLSIGQGDAVKDRALELARRAHWQRFRLRSGAGEWERSHGVAAEGIAAWLPTLPAGVRRYAQAEVYRYLHTTGSWPYGPDAVAAVVAKISDALGRPTEKLPLAAE